MARSSFQKLKILYVMDYLLQNSDEAHPVSMSRLISELESHGISAERKSIYDDIECLREYGVDIIQTGAGKGSGYYVAGRDFELPELKLLVDSVQSSKFITHKKTLSLIRKIEKLASVYEAQQLRNREKEREGYQASLDHYNELLKAVCEKNDALYINVADALKGEDNFLKLDYSNDKVCHLSEEGNAVLIEALKDYAQERYDLGLWDPFAEETENEKAE